MGRLWTISITVPLHLGGRIRDLRMPRPALAGLSSSPKLRAVFATGPTGQHQPPGTGLHRPNFGRYSRQSLRDHIRKALMSSSPKLRAVFATAHSRGSVEQGFHEVISARSYDIWQNGQFVSRKYNFYHVNQCSAHGFSSIDERTSLPQ